MELDDMKLAWQALDRQLERRYALDFQAFKATRLDRLHASLRPMQIGLVARIAFGILLMCFAAPVWAEYRDQPLFLITGLAVHLYGIALCVVSGRLLWMIGAIDYSAPVLDIQQRLARMRAFHLRSGFWLGNAWWVLWMPMLLLAMMWTVPTRSVPVIVDHSAGILRNLGRNTAFGVAVILLVTWLYRLWGKKYPDAQRRFEDQSSRSLANARKALDDIERFEKM